MGKLRPARISREWTRPYTRTAKRVVKRAYVRGVPDSMIRKFDMGNFKDFKKYDVRIDVVPCGRVQVRHNALESIRMALNRFMEKTCEKQNFYFKIRVYPHHVVREHAILSGAGADRLSQGMKHAFGRPSGRAARVKEGQPVLSLYTYKRFEKFAVLAGRKAAARLPLKSVTLVYKMKDGKEVKEDRSTKIETKPEPKKKEVVEKVKKVKAEVVKKEPKKEVVKEQPVKEVVEEKKETKPEPKVEEKKEEPKVEEKKPEPIKEEPKEAPKVEEPEPVKEEPVKEEQKPVEKEPEPVKEEFEPVKEEPKVEEPKEVPKPVSKIQTAEEAAADVVKKESVTKTAERVLEGIEKEKSEKTVEKKKDDILVI
jgi:large subunit ribosomal protein L10e